MTATEQPMAEAYPPLTTFVIEVLEVDRWLMVGSPYSGAERSRAEQRLAQRQAAHPDWVYRLVARTVTYTVVVPPRAVEDVPAGGVV